MGLNNIVALFTVLVALLSVKPIQADNTLQLDEIRSFPKVFQNERVDLRSFSPKYKLPEPVKPYRYDLSVIPILTEQIPERQPWTVYGSVRIYLQCLEETSQITVHKSPDLNISHESISVMTAGLSSIVIPVRSDFSYDEEMEFYTINLESSLAVETNYTVYIEFVAPIYTTGRLEGMYRSSYTNSTGYTSYLVTTQFQPTDFRRLAPSFDEPNLKAVFHTRVGYLSTKPYTTLSNSAKVDGQNPPIDGFGEGWVWDIYQPTVPTSTYLIAIIVTEDYGYVQAANDLYDKPIRTYGPTELIARGGGDFAAATAANQLAYFRDLFEIDYPMHKMDSIAIPDFSAGAMENWGLNTYRIQYLLNFPGETTEAERGLISNILAHELGHQWFGNPVTCQNWTNLWLNEGFATYVSYLGWDATDPEFEARKFFLYDAYQYSMVRDSNPATSHPIVNDGVTPDEVNSYFSAITYEKGGSLIRMMEGFLGFETLRKGLVRYLNDMYHKGALQDDLWRNLNAQAVEDGVLPVAVTVKSIMDTWTLQAGHPIVRVSIASSNLIFISQERIFQSNSSGELDPNHMWYVPVAIASAGDPDFSDFTPKLWIEPNVALKTFTIDTTRWLVVNPSGMGYYRVLYDTRLTNMILAQLDANHEVFSPESRSQFLDDYFYLAFQRYVSIDTALELTKYLEKETERIGWGAALAALRNSFNKLRGSDTFEEFKSYLVPKLASTLESIGLRQQLGENGTRVIFRATLLDWSCAMDYNNCIEYANDLVSQWQADPNQNPVPSDIQAVIYCTAVANGTQQIFDFIIERYVETLPGTQRTRLLNSLACATDSVLINNLLAEILLETSPLSDADKVNVLVRVATNVRARSLVLQFLNNEANLEALQALEGSIRRGLVSLVTDIGTANERTAIATFIEDNRESLDGVADLNLEGLLATIDSNIAWRSEFEGVMNTWFQNNK